MEIMQTRADLATSRTLGSLAPPWPILFTFLHCIAYAVLCKPGIAPSSIYTADNLGSPQFEPTSKPWLDLTWGEPGLGRFTLANLGRTRVSLSSVNWL